jgi:hypothetical protein
MAVKLKNRDQAALSGHNDSPVERVAGAPAGGVESEWKGGLRFCACEANGLSESGWRGWNSI